MLSLKNRGNENWDQGERLIFWENGRRKYESKQKCNRFWDDLRGKYLRVRLK